MKLSTKGEYGVRAMVFLAERYGQGPVSLSYISQKQNISLAYLEQLVAILRKAGLVESVRGAYGGYVLARDPRSISISEVIRPLESLAPVECVSDESLLECCEQWETCTTRIVWEKLRDSIFQALNSTTLSDLCSDRAS